MEIAIAPANVKLFGEHSVVYGRKCLASAVSLFAKAEVEETCKPGLKITLDDFNFLSQSFSVRALDEVYSNYKNRVVKDNTGINEYFLYLTERMNVSPHLVPILTIAAEIRQTGLVEVISKEVHISSNVPVKQGWGSSNVCEAAFVGSLLVEHNGFADKQIIDFIIDGEKVAHRSEGAGRIDSGPSFFGGFVTYSQANGYEPISVDIDLNLLAVNTGPKPATADMVAVVAKRLRDNREDTERIFQEIEECTNSGIGALRRKDLQGLGATMLRNQELLKDLGVSTSPVNRTGIDKCVKTAMENGAYGAKLSGGGGGGLVIVLCDSEQNEKIANALRDAGFSANKIRTSTKGIRDQIKDKQISRN
jgi:mevalonate kinase